MSNVVYYVARILRRGEGWVRLIQRTPYFGTWIEASNSRKGCGGLAVDWGLTIVRETHDTVTLYQGY